MTDNDIDHNTKQNSIHNAQEALKNFFDELEALEGMDRDVAGIILSLWSSKDLSRERVLAALERARTRGGQGDKEED